MCYMKVDHISCHYNDVIMGAMASQITSLIIVYSTVYSGTDQRQHKSSASLAFVWEIHRWPVNFPHKGPVTRKTFDDVIIFIVCNTAYQWYYSRCLSAARLMHLTQWFCSQESNLRYSSTGSDNGLVQYRRQAIIWTIGGIRYRRIYAVVGLKVIRLIT